MAHPSLQFAPTTVYKSHDLKQWLPDRLNSLGKHLLAHVYFEETIVISKILLVNN